MREISPFGRMAYHWPAPIYALQEGAGREQRTEGRGFFRNRQGDQGTGAAAGNGPDTHGRNG